MIDHTLTQTSRIRYASPESLRAELDSVLEGNGFERQKIGAGADYAHIARESITVDVEGREVSGKGRETLHCYSVVFKTSDKGEFDRTKVLSENIEELLELTVDCYQDPPEHAWEDAI